MKKAWNLFWAAIAFCAAISIGVDWYDGQPASAAVRVLAIVGCLLLAMESIERVFPFLKSER